MAVENAGSGGQVNSLNAVRHQGGSFGVTFKSSGNSTDNGRMETEDDELGEVTLMKSQRKQQALKISKKNHLIKKKLKQEKKKARRQKKIGKVVNGKKMKDD